MTTSPVLMGTAAAHDPPRPGWRPVSPCGPGCVPEAALRAGVRPLCRLAALVAVLVAVALTAPLLAPLSYRARLSWLRLVARALLVAAGVRVTVAGPPAAGARAAGIRAAGIGAAGIGAAGIGGLGIGGVLVVANHVSWVEILALSTLRPLRMVAKNEIRTWPVIGGVAEALGAVFVDRDSPRSLPASVDAIRRALDDGHAVGVFPEGTTWCGAAAGTFRRAAFQAAVDAAAPVRPVAVVLRTPDGRPARGASFVGGETLLANLYRLVHRPGLVCELTVLPMIHPGPDRAGLARRAAEAIGGVTGVPHPCGQAGPGTSMTRGAPLPVAASTASPTRSSGYAPVAKLENSARSASRSRNRTASTRSGVA